VLVVPLGAACSRHQSQPSERDAVEDGSRFARMPTSQNRDMGHPAYLEASEGDLSGQMWKD